MLRMQFARMHSWNGTVLDSQRVEKENMGQSSTPVPSGGFMPTSVLLTYPLGVLNHIQMEAADLHPMQFSSADYFSGSLCCRNAPFTLCAKLKPWFPAHICLSQLAAVLARVKKSNLVIGLGYAHKGLHDLICSPLIPLSSILYLPGEAGARYQADDDQEILYLHFHQLFL